MFKPTILFTALILFAFTPAPAPRSQAQEAAPAKAAPAAKTPVKSTPESQAKAKHVYGVDCAMCHGDNGNGKTDMATAMQITLKDWTNPASLANTTDEELFTIIRNGKEKMPPEAAGRANDDEVRNIILYIRKFSQGTAETPSATK